VAAKLHQLLDIAKIFFDMQNQMYAHLQQIRIRLYTHEKPGDILTRMESENQRRRHRDHQHVTTSLQVAI
jgi:ABC-type bacteriocin/lantibiotic exporter with double-glycine peptidase domain